MQVACLNTGNELEKCLIALHLHFSPTSTCSVCACKWASTMILLFDMWIKNVPYMNQVSSGQHVNGEDNRIV